MSKWKLVYNKELEGHTECPYMVHCSGKEIPAVFLHGGKRHGNTIEFTIFTYDGNISMSNALTEDQIKALPTDRVHFFESDEYPDMKLCRIWATL